MGCDCKRGSLPQYYLTAYGIAVAHGFRGTEEEWLESLIGPAGPVPEIEIGEILTGEPEEPAQVWFTGTKDKPILNMRLPQGKTGSGDLIIYEEGEV